MGMISCKEEKGDVPHERESETIGVLLLVVDIAGQKTK